jgi:outer membrane protein
MHLYGICFEHQPSRQAGITQSNIPARHANGCARWQRSMLTLAATMPSGLAQQTPAGASGPDKAASELPAAPSPVQTEPFSLRPPRAIFRKPAGRLLGNPINTFRPTTIAKASFVNSVRLGDLVKDGKIYLSLSDAIALAI